MKELQRKQQLRRVLYSIPSLIILTVLAFLVARGAERMVVKEYQSSERVEALAKQATDLASREEKLERNVTYLKTDEGVKEEIRSKFGVTQAGEHVAIIVDERHSSTSTDDMKKPWYKRFWDAIMPK